MGKKKKNASSSPDRPQSAQTPSPQPAPTVDKLDQMMEMVQDLQRQSSQSLERIAELTERVDQMASVKRARFQVCPECGLTTNPSAVDHCEGHVKAKKPVAKPKTKRSAAPAPAKLGCYSFSLHAGHVPYMLTCSTCS